MLRLLAASIFVTTALAQNCTNTSIGATPLTELGIGTYQGFTGGLYGGGQNVPPAAHLGLGQAAMGGVVPRDAAGAPSPTGRIVLLSIGMSNTTQEFSTWQTLANADPNRNPAVTIVDGAQGGQDAVTVANPNAQFWTVVDQRLAAAGATPAQVQVVWLKEAIAGVTGGFPAGAVQLQGLLAQIVQIVTARFPNARLCFCSSRTYAGYATVNLNPEPYAYESGFAVQWLLQQQMSGDPALNADPQAGAVVAPWLGFGPYLWADGTTPRLDGLTWTCADVQPDGTHPSTAGRAKVAAMLQEFFSTSPLCALWYANGASVAQFAVYGTGCPGASGVPHMRNNGLPRLGNAIFRVGVDGAAPQALSMLVIAGQAGNVPLAGPCALLVAPASALTSVFGTTSATGTRQFPLPIPNDPGLAGLELFAQWGVEDAAGAPLPGLAGLALSAGAHIVIGS